jgi:hypothetical protein
VSGSGWPLSSRRISRALAGRSRRDGSHGLLLVGSDASEHGSGKDLHVAAFFVDAFSILLAVVWRPGRETRRLKAGMLPVAVGLLIVGGVMRSHRGASSTETRSSVIGWRMPLGSGSRLDLRLGSDAVPPAPPERHQTIASSTRPPIGPGRYIFERPNAHIGVLVALPPA